MAPVPRQRHRLSQTLNGQPTAYTVDTANRLTSVGGTPVTTDADGNILVDATGNSYHWDARGRLTSVTHNGTTLASFTYASNGIRTSATEGGVTTNFTLDGTRCVNEAAGGVNTASMFGPTGVICRGTQWFTPTAQGSIGSVTDGIGNAIAQNRYGVFGQVVTTNPNSGNPLQFLGGMSDPTTGLDYMGHGFYSPGLGLNVGGGSGLPSFPGPLPGLPGGLGSGGMAPTAPGPANAAGSNRLLDAGSGSGDWLNHASDFFGCWGDTLTGGLTSLIRTWLGVNDQVHQDSGWCRLGTIVGTLHTILLTDPELSVCFPAGTPVLTAHGAKPIEQIRVGDVVRSANPRTGQQNNARVVRLFVHHADELLKIETADGHSVEATPTHPFWVEGKGFVAAKRLARSDLLREADGRTVAIVRITARQGSFTVYNFEVARTHTYYAGGFWVHNTCAPPKPSLADVKFNLTDDFIENKVLAGHGFGTNPDNSQFLSQFSNVQDVQDFIDQALNSGYSSAPYDAAHGTFQVTASFPYAIGVGADNQSLYNILFAFAPNAEPVTAFPF